MKYGVLVESAYLLRHHVWSALPGTSSQRRRPVFPNDSLFLTSPHLTSPSLSFRHTYSRSQDGHQVKRIPPHFESRTICYRLAEDGKVPLCLNHTVLALGATPLALDGAPSKDSQPQRQLFSSMQSNAGLPHTRFPIRAVNAPVHASCSLDEICHHVPGMLANKHAAQHPAGKDESHSSRLFNFGLSVFAARVLFYCFSLLSFFLPGFRALWAWLSNAEVEYV